MVLKILAKIIIQTTISLSAISLASADTMQENKEPSAPISGEDLQTQKNKPSSSPLPEMKTLLDDGSTLMPGDYILLSRPVGTWTLKCDLDLYNDKRVCWVEQNTTLGDNWLKWRFQITKQGTPFIVINTNAKIDPVNGLHMGFSGLEKVLRPGADLSCDEKSCIGGFDFSDFLGAAILASPEITFFFIDGSQTDKPQVKSVKTSMAGFKQAIDLAATNPYAPLPRKDEPEKNIKQESSATKEKTKPISKTVDSKKNIRKPVSQNRSMY